MMILPYVAEFQSALSKESQPKRNRKSKKNGISSELVVAFTEKVNILAVFKQKGQKSSIYSKRCLVLSPYLPCFPTRV